MTHQFLLCFMLAVVHFFIRYINLARKRSHAFHKFVWGLTPSHRQNNWPKTMTKGGCMRFDWIHFQSHNAKNNKSHYQIRAVELHFFPFQKINAKTRIFRNRSNEFWEVSQLGLHNLHNLGISFDRYTYTVYKYLVFELKVKMRPSHHPYSRGYIIL